MGDVTRTEAASIRTAGAIRSLWELLRNQGFTPVRVRVSTRTIATIAVTAGFPLDFDWSQPFTVIGLPMLVDDALPDDQWRIEVGPLKSPI